MEKLQPDEAQKKRLTLQQEFCKILGVKYKFGAEWIDRTKNPEFTDCSEANEGVVLISGLPMPDGAQAQFDFLLAAPEGYKPQVGDFGFFGHDKSMSKIYHTGMIYDANNMIEARAYDPRATFKTGEVILRPIAKWLAWKDFVGFRVHPMLIGA